MNKLKQSFAEFRKSVPKHVQWLLLAAAFIAVLILLTLLLRGKQAVENVDAVPAALPTLAISPDSIDWTQTLVGDTARQRIAISSSAPVRITAVRLSEERVGLPIPRTTCKNMTINDLVACHINLEYSPTAAATPAAVSLFVDWYPADQTPDMSHTDKIVIAVGAQMPPEPEPAPTIVEEIEAIAPPLVIPEPQPAPQTPDPRPQTDCSDFAFGGYDSAGRQIGWIRPDAGEYFFHPYSDTDCTMPTGVYNPDNGIITDINNPAVRIGTDAENIGYTTISNGVLPQLSNPTASRPANRALQLTTEELVPSAASARVFSAPPPDKIMTSSGRTVVSSAPYDRTFILRQYKPIPATIVSEIRADSRLLSTDHKLPVIATVDRNVYSDNGRTIIVPTGTTLYGYVTGDVPGPYKAIGRMEIRWYQFVRPDGVEFNFGGDANDPFSGDAQGRVGVPGRGSTDYMEQFVMPMLTAIVPAAVNMIAPISDRFINQIDLDNNTVTQSGQVRSSELAKNEIITAWNQVAQKLLVDMMDNTVPPFSIAAGTRINVFSPVDLQVTCGEPGTDSKKCAISAYATTGRAEPVNSQQITMAQSPENQGSMVGQVRSFDMDPYCVKDANGYNTGAVNTNLMDDIMAKGYDYRTVLFYCQSSQYQAINNVKAQAVFNNQQQTTYTDPATGQKMQVGSKEYNENVLGLDYNADGTIKNPFQQLPTETPPATLTCEDGTAPDTYGCCTGETYTDMGEQGFNCCPDAGGDCFPPII